MLGSVPSARDRVVEIRDIACRVNSCSIGLEVLIDENAAIHIDAAAGEKTNFRANPDSDRNNIAGYSFTAARRNAFDRCRAPKLFDLLSKNEIHTPCSKIFGKEIGHLR